MISSSFPSTKLRARAWPTTAVKKPCPSCSISSRSLRTVYRLQCLESLLLQDAGEELVFKGVELPRYVVLPMEVVLSEHLANRSFIDRHTFDGFRKVVESEFKEIYLLDLGGDVRANPKLSGTKHNVFGIQTGIAISFMVKRANSQKCKIRYARRPEFE